jgi:hypothetical protein
VKKHFGRRVIPALHRGARSPKGIDDIPGVRTAWSDQWSALGLKDLAQATFDPNPQLGFTVKITLVRRRHFASSTLTWETDFRGTETRGRIRGQGATKPLKWPPQTSL